MSFLTVGSSNRRPINRLAFHISPCAILPADPYVLDIEDSIGRVHSGLVLRSFTDEALLFGERDERRSGKASLLVGDCILGKTMSSVIAQVTATADRDYVLISTFVPS